MHDGLLIPRDSLLRRLPAGVDSRQRMFLDGISTSLQMLGIAFARLVVGLQDVARSPHGEHILAPLFLDAWSMVDSAHRLSVLLRHMEGVKNTPGMRIYKRKLQAVEPLRNSIQHLTKDILESADEGAATWGTLSWVIVNDVESAESFVAVPGSIVTTHGIHAPNPAGREVRAGVNMVELHAYGNSVDLSHLHGVAVEMARAFEANAAEWPDTHGRLGCDLLLVMRLGFSPDE